MPCSVLSHPNFCSLSAKSVKLLVDMMEQLRFKKGGPVNNGDICIAWKLMEKRGWKSKQTLRNALNELLRYRFVTVTRQGGRNKCSLYAIAWWSIDECKGKLDVKSTRTPNSDWKNSPAPNVPAKQS